MSVPVSVKQHWGCMWITCINPIERCDKRNQKQYNPYYVAYCMWPYTNSSGCMKYEINKSMCDKYWGIYLTLHTWGPCNVFHLSILVEIKLRHSKLSPYCLYCDKNAHREFIFKWMPLQTAFCRYFVNTFCNTLSDNFNGEDINRTVNHCPCITQWMML